LYENLKVPFKGQIGDFNWLFVDDIWAVLLKVEVLPAKLIKTFEDFTLLRLLTHLGLQEFPESSFIEDILHEFNDELSILDVLHCLVIQVGDRGLDTIVVELWIFA
jgi:hypothetical protein